MKTKDFISEFNEAEVIQRMASVKTPEEAYAVAKEYGVTDSLEEFVEEMTKFKAAIDELSEEDLEAVAGGMSGEDAVKISLSAVSAGSVIGSVSGVVLGSVTSVIATASGLATASAASVGATIGAAAAASAAV